MNRPMIEIIHEYWRNYLFTDGYRFTGLAITLWLLVVSIGLGFCLSVPLAVARVSKNRLLSRAVWLYTYIFAARRSTCNCCLLHGPLQPASRRSTRCSTSSSATACTARCSRSR